MTPLPDQRQVGDGVCRLVGELDQPWGRRRAATDAEDAAAAELGQLLLVEHLHGHLGAAAQLLAGRDHRVGEVRRPEVGGRQVDPVARVAHGLRDQQRLLHRADGSLLTSQVREYRNGARALGGVLAASLVRRERVAAEVVALGHRADQLRRTGGQCERDRRGVADSPGGDPGRSADRDVTGVLTESDDHQQRGADDTGRRDLGHLARQTLETQRREQRAQLAPEGLGHVLRAGREPYVLAGLPAELFGSHHDDVGTGLGGARAPQVVRRHPPHSNHGWGSLTRAAVDTG